MSGSDSDQDRPSEALRQRTVERLCEAFAEDRMSMDEFDRRIQIAQRSGNAEELRTILRALPAVVSTSSASTTRSAPPARRRPEAPVSVERRNLIMGVLGGGSRRGSWTPAENNLAIALMGGVKLDLRDARLRPGQVTNVDCFALFAGIEIVVPPDVRVECSGVGILGGFDYDQKEPPSQDPDAPVVRIHGAAMFGGVEVTVRRPGESKRDARRRRREQGGA